MADLLEIELGDRIVMTLSQVDGGELSQALFRLSGIVKFGMFDNQNALNRPINVFFRFSYRPRSYIRPIGGRFWR